MNGMTLSCALPATAKSVTAARHFVVDALVQWDRADLADTAALLTSEVVTNAVLHARTSMDIVVRLLGDGVAIEVTDRSQHSPRPRQPTLQSTTGRGLELLDRLADAWDVQILPTGKTVRFTLRDGVDPWAQFADHEWAADQ